MFSGLFVYKSEKKKWIIFGVLAFCLLFNLTWFLKINNEFNSLISEREQRVENLNQEINRLKKIGQINISKNDIENLYKVENNRIRWANKLEEFSRITPADMAITGIEYTSNKMILEGISLINPNEKGFQITENLISSMESNQLISSDFTNIRFKNYERKINRGQEILEFVIEADLIKKKSKK